MYFCSAFGERKTKQIHFCFAKSTKSNLRETLDGRIQSANGCQAKFGFRSTKVLQNACPRIRFGRKCDNMDAGCNFRRDIPKETNMKIINHKTLLTICVLALTVFCWQSIAGPLRFDEERKRREHAVISRLLHIRSAAETYRSAHGVYAGSLDELIGSDVLADSMKWIPFSDHRTFTLETTTEMTPTGKTVSLMECGVPYQTYLQGLDEQAIATLIEDATKSGTYPGLKIGDLKTNNNNAGNWE